MTTFRSSTQHGTNFLLSMESGASMHMIGREDQNSAELETVKVSQTPNYGSDSKCNGEVQTHEEATVYVKDLDFFLTVKSWRIRQQYCLSESFAKITDIHMSGPIVKNHISLKMVFRYNVIRRTSYHPWSSVYTHFPKDRNGEICQRTKITRSQCRRRIAGIVPGAEKFGDLITADHKILSGGWESRNNHRCADVVQDLATQWIQPFPSKTKTSQETERSLQKFLEPTRKPKDIYTDNSLEFGKASEDLS